VPPRLAGRGQILNWRFFPRLCLPCGLPPQEQDGPYQPPPPPASTARSTTARVQPIRTPPAGPRQRLRTGDSLRSAAGPAVRQTGLQRGCLASWYGPPYANRKAADGSVYDQNAMTAAHRTLPMGSIVRVTNLANDQSVVVRITDRGPFVGDRIIDLSLAAARETGVYRAGVARVRVEAYAPPVHPGVDPAGKWCVQIGASRRGGRHQAKNSLIRRYSTAKVIEFAGPTGHWVASTRRTPTRHSQQDRGEHPRPRPRSAALHRPLELTSTGIHLPRPCAAGASSAGGA